MVETIKILLAEDDKNLGMILKSYLTSKGYPTVLCFNGSEALNQFEVNGFDFLIIDVMMPVVDGYSLAKEIRKIDKDIPIIFLTAKSLQSDVIHGFEIGADDYIIKPFSIEELMYRIEAVARRSKNKSKNQHVFQLSSYIFDSIRHVLIRNGVEKKLTTRELDLLVLFCEYKNRVVERSLALQKIWHDDNYFNARNMDVYINKIRRLLKEDPNVELKNIHGVGYKLVVRS